MPRPAPVLVLLLLTALVAAAPVAAQDEDPVPEREWIEGVDRNGLFRFEFPEGWGEEPWEKDGRQGLKVRPLRGDPFHGGLFGVETIADRRVAGRLDAASLARFYENYYTGQGAKARGAAAPFDLGGVEGLAQRFVLPVVRDVDGEQRVFTLEYRVVCAHHGGVAYIINLAAEQRLLEANADVCRRLVESVRLTPPDEDE